MPATLYDLVAGTAERTPGADALEVDGQVVTYAELLGRADRIAGWLAATAPAPAAVGLLAARSVAAYAGYLAVLRLGGTVVPLNPGFPARRGRTAVLAAGATVVLGEPGADVAAVVAGTPARAAVLPPDWARSLPGDPPPAYRGRPDDVAYVLFTSGSTGTPKGVPIRHRQLAGYFPYMIRRLDAGPGSRVSQVFDLTFDPSVHDLFLAWASGATLVVPRAEELLLPARFVAGRGITHWCSVPSVITLAGRLRGLRPGGMPTLRSSVFCGDRLTVEQARLWVTAAPNGTLDNAYGPTELTITCTAHRLPADPADWPVSGNGTVPIGTAYPGTEVAVLTEDGTEADTGELCLRGAQRFDGYTDPADNAGRFVPDPGPGPVTDRHWYRSGDRVRREDGRLVHLGRLDSQVKIHGFRVELGEVESALRAHPAVEDAVAVAAAVDAGETRLHAFVTGAPVPEQELADLVATRLPDYMVPRRVTYLTAFPTTANGKIDRATLATEK